MRHRGGFSDAFFYFFTYKDHRTYLSESVSFKLFDRPFECLSRHKNQTGRLTNSQKKHALVTPPQRNLPLT